MRLLRVEFQLFIFVIRLRTIVFLINVQLADRDIISGLVFKSVIILCLVLNLHVVISIFIVSFRIGTFIVIAKVLGISILILRC